MREPFVKKEVSLQDGSEAPQGLGFVRRPHETVDPGFGAREQLSEEKCSEKARRAGQQDVPRRRRSAGRPPSADRIPAGGTIAGSRALSWTQSIRSADRPGEARCADVLVDGGSSATAPFLGTFPAGSLSIALAIPSIVGASKSERTAR